MTNPLVTVVVPIYNVEKYLDRCLNAIVSQTYKNLEIILVDDGSPDRCPQMCEQWAQKDERVVVVHKANAGLGMARNTGIEKATGKYIFFLDSDDYVDITLVEKCVKSAEEYGSDAVIYGRCDVYEDGKAEKMPMRITDTVFSGPAVTEKLLPAMFTYDMGFGVSAWGKMFSLATIRGERLCFLSEREMISEDAYFALAFFSCASAVSVIDENLYFYYKRSASLSRAFRADRQQKNNDFLRKSLDFATEAGLPDKVKVHITARYHMYCISAMKQIMGSDLPKTEKKRKLREIYRDAQLRQSITGDVLRIDPVSIAAFLLWVKGRMYFACDMLLKMKTRK